jgi:hypothetical protein
MVFGRLRYPCSKKRHTEELALCYANIIGLLTVMKGVDRTELTGHPTRVATGNGMVCRAQWFLRAIPATHSKDSRSGSQYIALTLSIYLAHSSLL